MFSLFQGIASRYDRSNTIISMGMHRRWKRHMVCSLTRLLPSGGRVLDLCCGTGDITAMLLEAGRDFQVIGADFSPNMLREAKRKLSKLPKGVRYSLTWADAMNLPWAEGTFDGAVISFGLRNTPDWAHVLEEMVRVTKTGGIVCIMDAHYPEHTGLGKVFSLYFTWIMPVLGGGRKYREQYGWLNRSAKEFAGWRQLMEMMGQAGLTDRRYKRFGFGSCVYQIGVKSGRRRCKAMG